MGKYEPIADFLGRIDGSEPVVLSFADIEELIGSPLPPSAQDHQAWWSPSQSNAVWVKAGWVARPKLGDQLVVFHPVGALLKRTARFSQTSGAERLKLLPVPEAGTDWDDYDRWNVAVEEEFFDGSRAHQSVYLDLEDEVLERIAAAVGVSGEPAGELSTCVRKTLIAGVPGMRTFSRHINRLRRWRSDGAGKAPPFLALLATFSLVAERMREGQGMRANNYMDRLCNTLGCEASDADGRAKLKADFRAQSHELWDALNEWLEAAEGERGLPTARVFDWRVHVGLPISQALVKQADRNKFPRLFDHWGLRPGQTIAPRDMQRILAEWLPSSGVSPFLKEAWARGADDRAHIAEIVCVELESWDGSVDAAHSGASEPATLRIAGRLRRFPSPRLDLWVTVPGTGRAAPGHYTPTTDATNVKAALGGHDAGVTIPDEINEQYVRVVADEEISIPDLLLASIVLENSRGARLKRQPRAVVVLVQDDVAPFYVEVERLELGRSAMLLVHRNLESEVLRLLSNYARHGYENHQPATLPGTPADWTLITGVQLSTIPTTSDPSLGPLVPLAWNAATYEGGFQLPGGSAWHSQRPPVANVSALDSDEAIATLTQMQSFDGELAVDLELARFSGTAELDLSQLGLSDGDFLLEISKPVTRGRGKSLITSRLKLRSASTFRPLVDPSRISRGLGLDAEAAVSAREAADMQGPSLRGALISGTIEASEPRAMTSPIASSLNLAAPHKWQPEDDSGPVGSTEAKVAAAGCVIGGAHWWILPPAGPDQPARKGMEAYCKHCGLTKWFPRRPPMRKAKGLVGAACIAAVAKVTSPAPQLIPKEPISHNLLLDALSYAQRGTWASFVRLAQQIEDSNWFAREAARNLSALGHIDLVLDRGDLSPKRWAIAPTTLATMPGKPGAILCGFRSRALVEQLCEIVETFEGTFRLEPQIAGPDIIRIEGLDENLPVVAELLSDALNVEATASYGPAATIASSLPAMTRVLQARRHFAPPIGVDVFVYNALSNSWQAVDSILNPGAYRLLTRPVAYGVLTEAADQLARADNRWSKWMAAPFTGAIMLAYDPDMETLSTRLGAQLPGLYERAAVLCSGALPEQLQDGTARYHSVPRAIAEQIWAAISSAR